MLSSVANTAVDFTHLSFWIPPISDTNKRVNEILSASFCFQKLYHMSNACRFVNIYLHKCLQTVGINVNIIYALGSYDLDIIIPHICLIIG